MDAVVTPKLRGFSGLERFSHQCTQPPVCKVVPEVGHGGLIAGPS
jgi:hypothetical protein